MGKYDLWNKNTKKWADKYKAEIIKKYPKYGCVHTFKLTAISAINKVSKGQVFECFAVAPENDNKDGKIVVLIDGFGYGYCVPGNNIDKFLKEYAKKVVDARYKLILKYNNVGQYKDTVIPTNSGDEITFVFNAKDAVIDPTHPTFTFGLGVKDPSS